MRFAIRDQVLKTTSTSTMTMAETSMSTEASVLPMTKCGNDDYVITKRLHLPDATSARHRDKVASMWTGRRFGHGLGGLALTTQHEVDDDATRSASSTMKTPRNRTQIGTRNVDRERTTKAEAQNMTVTWRQETKSKKGPSKASTTLWNGGPDWGFGDRIKTLGRWH